MPPPRLGLRARDRDPVPAAFWALVIGLSCGLVVGYVIGATVLW